MVVYAYLLFLIRAGVALVVLGLLPAGCVGLFFYPSHEIVLTPERLGLSHREVWFASADGTRLHGWLLPAQGEPRGTVLHVHGNAGNISSHVLQVAWLPKAGFNVFVFDYRGYGRSQGEPTIQGLEEDTRAALRTVLALPETDGRPVAVLGQSLGGVIAVTALAGMPERQRVCLMVMEGAFAGYRRIVRDKLAGFWLTWPWREPLSAGLSGVVDPVDVIASLAPVPVLIIHGGADETVPVAHAYSLYAAAQAPKSLWIVPDVGHTQVFMVNEDNRLRLVAALTGACHAEGGHFDRRDVPLPVAAAGDAVHHGQRHRPGTAAGD